MASNMIRMTSCIFTNPMRWFSKTYDPKAVKDAPRPKAEDFKYSEPYLYHMTEDMLNEFPEDMKRVFGISTLGQSDLNKLKKQEIVAKFQRKASDTVALLTERIRRLTEHLWYHHKDYTAKRRMYILVGKRKKLMKYLRNNNFERYVYTIRELKMNDIGPSLPLPSYRQNSGMSELRLRFRNENLYPPNPFYQDGRPE
ncbi:30S ribosomal protein S15 [Blastocystis sp. subtype 4]|uniref:30S ribosomal protein S15 n=1 Tax=Blastocystis sp. subtype 4 TaxID=944170 RepID=UPI000711E1F3|nr:30S ribosomal protein S15 [Blastocystis sp. subtype 4]KNB43217.1 30S ribosomal protein S15 [Blastocystis sp. subtype 4]|eukprot:XP_014526660.1 30S ribosomal protein S15 [Blastocystis sp. subtype 4]